MTMLVLCDLVRLCCLSVFTFILCIQCLSGVGVKWGDHNALKYSFISQSEIQVPSQFSLTTAGTGNKRDSLTILKWSFVLRL